MGIQGCDIIFDNPYGTYYAGQTVTGRVNLVFDSPKKVRGVTLCFKGASSTEWQEQETRSTEGKSESYTVTYSGSEEYFKTEYYLIGGQNGSLEIPAGQQMYDFTCLLPPTLPSSFEGEYGHVRYTVVVKLDRPWKFDQHIKKAFTVLSPLDLNYNLKLKEPVRVTLEKYFCCCWCQSGPLTCVVSLPFTGYVPGQTFPILAEVDNASNVEVTNVNFVLRKIVTYHSQTPHREHKKDVKVITELKVGPVPAHGSQTWNQPFQIPSLPPSNLTNCSLIDLDYELYVEVDVSGFHGNMDSKIPITIGTVPLVPSTQPTAPPGSVAVNMYPSQPAGSNPNIGWSHNGTNDPPPPYPVATFSPSAFGTQNIAEKGDSENTMYFNNAKAYSPMYPVFTFNNQS